MRTHHAGRFTPIATAVLLVWCLPNNAFAQAQAIQLPAPRKDGGRPLMQVLQDRQSQREFRREPLPLPMLSALLWAAFGINRPDGHRTAPSASNRQEIDIYVAMPEGLYLYEPKSHGLKLIVAEDLRGATGTQAFAAEAAIDLVFVADQSKMSAGSGDDRVLYAGADTGFISQNVYLYCASEGLATVVRGSVDRPVLGRRMQLRPDQRIVLAQSVGYPSRK
jgi:SagB-type dehydrogenase family enzyme